MAWRELGPDVYLKDFYVREFGAAANCLAFRYGDGLAILSPGPEPQEEDFAFLERRGPVRALVIPNGAHSKGWREWARRFPRALICAPAPAIPALAKKGIPGVKPLSALRGDPAVELRAFPGTRVGGTLAILRVDGRVIVYLDELVMNLPAAPSGLLVKALYRATGSVPGIRCNKIFYWAGVRDARELVAAYREAIAAPGLFVPAHGAVMHTEPDIAELKALVERLAARCGLSEKKATRLKRAA